MARRKRIQERATRAEKRPKVSLTEAIKEQAQYIYDYVFADGEYDKEREESFLEAQDPRVIQFYEKLKKDRAKRERQFYKSGDGAYETFGEHERRSKEWAFERKFGMTPREFGWLDYDEKKKVRAEAEARELSRKRKPRKQPATPAAIRKRAPGKKPTGRMYRYKAYRGSWVHDDAKWRALDNWATLQPGYWANHMGPHLGLVIFEAEPEELATFLDSMGIYMDNFVVSASPRGKEWSAVTEGVPPSRPGAAPVVKPEKPFAGNPYDVVRVARYKALKEVPKAREREGKIERIGAFLKEADKRGLDIDVDLESYGKWPRMRDFEYSRDIEYSEMTPDPVEVDFKRFGLHNWGSEWGSEYSARRWLEKEYPETEVSVYEQGV